MAKTNLRQAGFAKADGAKLRRAGFTEARGGNLRMRFPKKYMHPCYAYHINLQNICNNFNYCGDCLCQLGLAANITNDKETTPLIVHQICHCVPNRFYLVFIVEISWSLSFL